MCKGGTPASEAVTVCTTHVNKTRARWFLTIYRQVERHYKCVYAKASVRLTWLYMCCRLHKCPAATNGIVVLCTRSADHLLLHTILRPSRSTVVSYALLYCLLAVIHTIVVLLLTCCYTRYSDPTGPSWFVTFLLVYLLLQTPHVRWGTYSY